MAQVIVRNPAGGTMIIVELRDGELVFSKEGPLREALVRARVAYRGKLVKPEDGLKWLKGLPDTFNGVRVRAEYKED